MKNTSIFSSLNALTLALILGGCGQAGPSHTGPVDGPTPAPAQAETPAVPVVVPVQPTPGSTAVAEPDGLELDVVELPWGGSLHLTAQGVALEYTASSGRSAVFQVPTVGEDETPTMTRDELHASLVEYSERIDAVVLEGAGGDFEGENYVAAMLAEQMGQIETAKVVGETYVMVRDMYEQSLLMHKENPEAVTEYDTFRAEIGEEGPAVVIAAAVERAFAKPELLARLNTRMLAACTRAAALQASLVFVLSDAVTGMTVALTPEEVELGGGNLPTYPLENPEDPQDLWPWEEYGRYYGEEIDPEGGFEIASKFKRIEAMELTPGAGADEILFQGVSELVVEHGRESYGVQYFREFGATPTINYAPSTDYNPPQNSYPKATPVVDFPWYHQLPPDSYANYYLRGAWTEEDFGDPVEWRGRLKILERLIEKGIAKGGQLAIGYLTGGLSELPALVAPLTGIDQERLEDTVEKLRDQYDKNKDKISADATGWLLDELAELLGDDPLYEADSFTCRIVRLNTEHPRYLCWDRNNTPNKRYRMTLDNYHPVEEPFVFPRVPKWADDDDKGQPDLANYKVTYEFVLRPAESRWPAPGIRGDEDKLGMRRDLHDPAVELTPPDH